MMFASRLQTTSCVCLHACVRGLSLQEVTSQNSQQTCNLCSARFISCHKCLQHFTAFASNLDRNCHVRRHTLPLYIRTTNIYTIQHTFICQIFTRLSLYDICWTRSELISKSSEYFLMFVLGLLGYMLCKHCLFTSLGSLLMVPMSAENYIKHWLLLCGSKWCPQLTGSHFLVVRQEAA